MAPRRKLNTALVIRMLKTAQQNILLYLQTVIQRKCWFADVIGCPSQEIHVFQEWNITEEKNKLLFPVPSQLPAKPSSATRHLVVSFKVLVGTAGPATQLLETIISFPKLVDANMCLCLCPPWQNSAFWLHPQWGGVKTLKMSSGAEKMQVPSGFSARGGTPLSWW